MISFIRRCILLFIYFKPGENSYRIFTILDLLYFYSCTLMMGPPLVPALITLKGLSYINIIIIIIIIVIISFIIISIIIIQMFGPSCK